jgi:hypothetical protein
MVVLAQDELGGHVRPRIQWPGRIPNHRGLAAPAPAQGLLGQRARYSVVETDERLVVVGLAAVQPGLLRRSLPVTGVASPLTWGLSREGDHPGEQHEQPRRELAGRQGRGERTVGLAHDHQILPPGDRISHGARVIVQARGVVVAWQVRRDRLVSPGLQLRLGQMPVPAGVAGAVNQHEGRRVRGLSRVVSGTGRTLGRGFLASWSDQATVAAVWGCLPAWGLAGGGAWPQRRGDSSNERRRSRSSRNRSAVMVRPCRWREARSRNPAGSCHSC